MRLYNDQLIVVTGGAGFIGSNVLKYLNEQDQTNLVVVDQLGATQKWKNLLGKRFTDYVDKKDFFKWLDGKENEVGAFIHLGACTSTVETDASYLIENNYRFSVKLAEYALTNGQKFIYASSAATYGDGTLGFKDQDQMLNNLRPLNAYGFSKHIFDLWLLNQGAINDVIGLKYFNVYGPNEGHKGRMASAIYHLFNELKKPDGKIRLFKSSEPEKFGDGEQKRDFIYVKDAARMTCAFLENHTKGGIYNIGTGSPTTWNQVAKALLTALGKKQQIEYIPMPQDLIGIYQNYTCAEIGKTKKALGKVSQCQSLDEAVKDYVCNYLIPGKIW